jgi:hypothetical protein
MLMDIKHPFPVISINNKILNNNHIMKITAQYTASEMPLTGVNLFK